jgi:hypothetical protein
MFRTASPFFSFGGSLLVPLQLSGNQKIPEAFVYKASETLFKQGIYPFSHNNKNTIPLLMFDPQETNTAFY